MYFDFYLYNLIQLQPKSKVTGMFVWLVNTISVIRHTKVVQYMCKLMVGPEFIILSNTPGTVPGSLSRHQSFL